MTQMLFIIKVSGLIKARKTGHHSLAICSCTSTLAELNLFQEEALVAFSPVPAPTTALCEKEHRTAGARLHRDPRGCKNNCRQPRYKAGIYFLPPP